MASLGAISFEYDLFWLTKPGPNDLQGVDKRALDGSIISIRIDPPSGVTGEHTFRFEWETYANVALIFDYWQSTSTRSITPETGGGTYTCRFLANKKPKYAPVVPQDGFVHADVLGWPTELYSGEFTVWIL